MSMRDRYTTKPWTKMSVDEKLDSLRKEINNLIAASNASKRSHSLWAVALDEMNSRMSAVNGRVVKLVNEIEQR